MDMNEGEHENLIKLVRGKWKDKCFISEIDKVAEKYIPENILQECDAFAVR